MAKKQTTRKKKNPLSITIEDKTFIPTNLDEDFTLDDHNFAIQHCAKEINYATQMFVPKKFDLKNIKPGMTTEEITNDFMTQTDAMLDKFTEMSTVQLTAELLSLCYKEESEGHFVMATRDERVEYFGRMLGTKNKQIATNVARNFITSIGPHITDAMSIFFKDGLESLPVPSKD